MTKIDYLLLLTYISCLVLATYMVRFVMPTEAQLKDKRSTSEILLVPLLNSGIFPVKLTSLTKLVMWMEFVVVYCLLYTTVGYMVLFTSTYLFYMCCNDAAYLNLALNCLVLPVLTIIASVSISTYAKIPLTRTYLIEVIGIENYNIYVGANPVSSLDKYNLVAAMATTSALVVGSAASSYIEVQSYKEQLEAYKDAYGELLKHHQEASEQSASRLNDTAAQIVRHRKTHMNNYYDASRMLDNWYSQERTNIEGSGMSNAAKVRAMEAYNKVYEERQAILMDSYKNDQLELEALIDRFNKVKVPDPSLEHLKPATFKLSDITRTISKVGEAISSLFKK